jgi:glycine/D-amino acid oxidase-like deaminating enzyme
VRKAGFVNAKALIGFYMDHPNVQVVRGFAKRIIKAPGTNKIESVAYTETENGKDLEHIHASKVVIAVGPMLKDFLAMNDIYLPKAGISLELHARVDFNDFKGYIPENAPFSIWSDEMDIQLDHEKTPKRYKGGVHIRPFPTKENPFRVTAIWTYETTPSELRFPAVDYVDPFYKEVIFKGLAKAFPNLQLYSDMFSRNPNDPNLNAQVYAGYYCKTRENRPLIGPLAEDQFEGLYITSALSGMGMISSGISGELLAAHMFNDTAFLKYAESFAPQLHPNRYTRLPESYFTSLDATSGQL